MDLIKTLGLNLTIVVQFFVFVFTYLVLTRLIFRPYYNAFCERYNRTVGSEDQAFKLLAETEQLQSEYEENAKALNFKIKNIYDEEKKVAVEQQTKKMAEAAVKTEEYRNSAELRLQHSRNQIKTELAQEVGPLADLIQNKVLGKGVTSQ